MKTRLLNKVQLVLETVSRYGSLTINELAEKFNIPLPTMSRLISDMAEMKLVEKIDYYRVVPASGLIRLGECARKHSYLVQQISPILERHAEKVQMNVLLAGFDEDIMFPLYHRGAAEESSSMIWKSGLALVLMAQAKLSPEVCRELFVENMPEISDTELMILNRELESIQTDRMLFRSNTMRNWSCSYGFKYHKLVCGFCFYGQAPDYSRERFILDCSRVLSRITAIFKAE